ncbi:metallophosphoesterase [Calothrix sp. NIES-3974]|uniref:metallophosphoesterase n=1 Tax=Calothrix sp. NIES-3974 TaxID=2005462 RepID=UPI000B619898|nr:metallophosphoesterase [Calothrix sp. NIES-3974]BAZ07797.1 metallophosphoesterase [Calothrix sp. NIES-3974]
MHKLLSGPLSVERLNVRIADLPKSLSGTKIVHLSDLHYDGLRLSEQMLADAIAITNESEPDLIVLTGDYVTDDPSPIYHLVRRLKYLEARVGVFAVLGNHDIYYKHSQSIITQALTSIGIQVLWNQIAYPFGEQLPIVGLADYWSREFRPAPVMEQLSDRTPRIVLSHNPDTAEILSKWRVDLQLSGHTHGGQFVLPGFGPIVLYYHQFTRQLPKKVRARIPCLRVNSSKVVRHWEWAQGFHRIGKNQLYVNRGLGTYPPGRFFCTPEVTVITLT